MPTFVYRCESCKTDWQQFFKIADKPEKIICPGCESCYARSVVTAIPVIFKATGFPGNDAKHLETGKSSGSVGVKPTHKHMEYVEKVYPHVHDAEPAKKIMDKVKSGSHRPNFGRR